MKILASVAKHRQNEPKNANASTQGPSESSAIKLRQTSLKDLVNDLVLHIDNPARGCAPGVSWAAAQTGAEVLR